MLAGVKEAKLPRAARLTASPPIAKPALGTKTRPSAPAASPWAVAGLAAAGIVVPAGGAGCLLALRERDGVAAETAGKVEDPRALL